MSRMVQSLQDRHFIKPSLVCFSIGIGDNSLSTFKIFWVHVPLYLRENATNQVLWTEKI